ncbi:hypothetical protein B0H10DRAFT_2329477 [Mycena sp. CBHHK59/15]|nr:hypothetical protein B0H10DRAFT_2329477 [Mycena sp. CBHHK59/15]
MEMAENMRALGLDALAINSETRSEAQRRRNEDLWVVARTKPNVVLTGPEQLKSDDFEKALRDEEFYERICGTGFDEVHLLNTWGVSFRKDFGQMGFVKARLHHGYHLIRRSCARPDVQILFRTLVSPISGDSFPELDCVLLDKQPTIIFPKHISLAARIYAYLVRMANSDNPNLIRILLLAPTLSVGVGMPARLDAILIGDVEDCDDFLQKLGRVGRTKTAGAARAIVYVTPAARVLAEKAIVYDETGICKAGEALPEISIARLIMAKCKVAEIGRLYDNPVTKVPCTCSLCSKHPPPPRPLHCNCSGCIPENLPPITRPARVSKVNLDIPPNQRLSKIQRAHGTRRLLALRIEIWKAADQAKFWMFPPLVFFPDAAITAILDNFILLDKLPRVTRFVKPYKHLHEHAERLFEIGKRKTPQISKPRKLSKQQKPPLVTPLPVKKIQKTWMATL